MGTIFLGVSLNQDFLEDNDIQLVTMVMDVLVAMVLKFFFKSVSSKTAK